MLSLDHRITQKITSLSSLDNKYWSFTGRDKRKHSHGLIKYPAMMVPEMQGELIDIFTELCPQMNSIFDPFVGSGTTLGEAIMRGLDFTGIDINPLAILACEVKSDSCYIKSLEEKTYDLFDRVKYDNSVKIDVDFPTIDKWFLPEVQVELSAIRRAIKMEESKWARRFFWVAFSDAVRGVCNSRSSTYKLHIKPDESLNKIGGTFDIFKKKVESNFQLKKEQYELAKSKGHIGKSKFTSNIKLKISDIRNKPRHQELNKHDLLITSPPYGDNSTTVPYGQFSYLPLMWIDTDDLTNSVSKKLLENASSIDSASLGGSLKKALDDIDSLMDTSESYKATLNQLLKYDNNGSKRFSSFIKGIDSALESMLLRVKNDGYLVWTLGNRRICDIEIPLNSILRELLESLGCTYVMEIDREIPFKRMASRNNSSKTMNDEKVLIMRK